MRSRAFRAKSPKTIIHAIVVELDTRMAKQESLRSVAPSIERAGQAPLRFEPVPVVVPVLFVPVLFVLFATITGFAIAIHGLQQETYYRYRRLFVGAWIGASILCVFIVYRIHQFVSRYMAERRQRAEQANLVRASVERATAEADRCTKKLETILAASIDCVSRIQPSIERAHLIVQQAEHAFVANACISFGDLMEDASEVFASLADDFVVLGSYRSEYRALLRGRAHTFPAFLNTSTLSDPSECAERFVSLVQRADHNYELAHMWAIRRQERSNVSYRRHAGESPGNAAVIVVRAYADFRDNA